jgi:hypothetical protein
MNHREDEIRVPRSQIASGYSDFIFRRDCVGSSFRKSQILRG